MRAPTASDASRFLEVAHGDMRLVRSWPARRWVAAILVATTTALVTGIPTGIIETSFYSRMTPVTWWDVPVWALSAILVGLTAATYVSAGRPPGGLGRSSRTLGATLLSTFAVGCPICNKLVVAVLGVGGALSYWAPLQPALGVLAVVLLATGLMMRLRGGRSCSPTGAP